MTLAGARLDGAPKVAVERGPRGVTTLTIDRPDRHNALDGETVDLLAAAVASAGADASVRVLVIRGRGRHFSAGADLAPETGTAAEKASGATIVELCRILDASPKPTIAVVQGACIGGAVAIVACCDLALAARDAFFAIPEVRLGFAPGPLAVFFARAMPPRALRRYMVSGARFTAQRARELGLVHETVAEEQIEAALQEAIESFLLAAPEAAADAKRILAAQHPIPAGERLLAEMQAEFDRRVASDAAREGRASFREKRRPRWAE